MEVTDISGGSNVVVEYPCLSSGSGCISSIGAGNGLFQFYSSYHIDSLSNVRGVVISVHGNSRNANDYFDKMISVLASEDLIDQTMVIAPRFITIYDRLTESDWYWNSTSWKWGLQSYNSAFGDNVSSFEMMDSLLSRLSNKDRFPLLTNVLITGHSSGAAFAQMYSASKYNNTYMGLNIDFASVNNQYFVHPEASRLQPDGTLENLNDCDGYNDWPNGLQNPIPYMEQFELGEARDNFYSNVVDYFTGEFDVNTDNITSGCQNDILGSNRLEKTINFNTYMDMIYPENMHQHTIIPGMTHSTNSFSSDTFRAYLNSIFSQ